VTFVNHTFTSHLALSASLQPYAGLADHDLSEFPFAPKPLARELTSTSLQPNRDGAIAAPEAPGLGIEIDLEAVRKYIVEVNIEVAGRSIYSTPSGL